MTKPSTRLRHEMLKYLNLRAAKEKLDSGRVLVHGDKFHDLLYRGLREHWSTLVDRWGVGRYSDRNRWQWRYARTDD